ncbi:MAG: 2-5 ligase [Betaproteobacteria bacterium]|jgi:2'-5' RNA ligase|nr:2-5 ligase [Betaproteobacteria bacterium]MEA3152502.1 2,3-cyclic 3-phosphodiesterase [Betaproteobacteria bacterium]
MAASGLDRARVFFALWPDADVTNALAAAGRVAQEECGGRAIAAEKLHMTLFFVGNIERARLASLKALARSIDGAAFEVDIDTIAYWRHNRIVWAGTQRCPRELAGLVHGLHERLATEGIKGEDRPYAPHVTLVRNAQRAPQRTGLEPFAWRADDFVLVESVPGHGGVRYDVIERWRLAAPA